MTTIPRLTRRAALAAAAALPAASFLPAAARAAAHEGEGAAKRSETHRTFPLGEMEITTLLAGTRTAEDDPQGTFGMNVDPETFTEVSRENFIPADKSQFFFTPTLVRNGEEVVLFDTGLDAQGITAALSAAGHAPEDVTLVVITHMHPDHIGGLMADGSPTFGNARYVTGQVEYDFWAGQENELFEKNVRPLADQMTFIGDGDEVAPGITGIAAFGHTPGHMVHRLSSGDRQLVITADTANHHVWSLAYPDWEVRFDMDKAKAAEARRQVFGMIAAERIPFIGYHMPFPALGYVDEREDGFRYMPETYQMMLDG